MRVLAPGNDGFKIPSTNETQARTDAIRKACLDEGVALKKAELQNIIADRQEELDRIISLANEAHGKGILKLRSAIEDYRVAGTALNSAKKILGHGYWQGWFNDNHSKFHFKISSARIYMRLDKKWGVVEKLFGENKPCLEKIIEALKVKPEEVDEYAGDVLNEHERDEADYLGMDRDFIRKNTNAVINRFTAPLTHLISQEHELAKLCIRMEKFAERYKRIASIIAEYDDETFPIKNQETKSEDEIHNQEINLAKCKRKLLSKSHALGKLTSTETRLVQDRLEVNYQDASEIYARTELIPHQ